MEKKPRREQRARSSQTEMVTIFRDRRDIPFARAFEQLGALADLYTVFSVVAVIKDISTKGLGMRIDGQQLMARNMLRSGERYLLKFTLAPGRLLRSKKPFLRSEGTYSSLLVKAICRWAATAEGRAAAGFELLDSNPPEVLDFFLSYFKLGGKRTA